MHDRTFKFDMQGPRWVQTAVGLALVVIIFIITRGMTVDVAYDWSYVHSVQSVAGQDSYHRAVVIETPERRRLVRTSEILLQVEARGYVCTARQTRLARRWVAYRLALPGFCQSRPHPNKKNSTPTLEAPDTDHPQNTRDGPDSVPYPEALRLP